MKYPHKTPWTVNADNEHQIMSAEGQLIATFLHKATAHFVVRLVNKADGHTEGSVCEKGDAEV